MTTPATTTYNGIEHPYAPNPRLSGEDWKREFPPIQTDAEYLRNKFTGILSLTHQTLHNAVIFLSLILVM